ncbi:uncharacterized protein C683.02c-like [Medicago truncatula]|uniref:uncharacterized protein C683.02c-like n=1 Tax=Medicago truncatula TaxID=3880 RepID=UPI001967AF3F|nr:uncharacterized protein C683.02c-like [Medicago truncatula]
MAGRNDAAIAAALEAVAQAVGQQPNVNAGANAEVRMLETFLRNHPRTFKGRREFLERYFPKDVRGKKEIEFLELKQGAMSVTEYVANCRIYEEDTKAHYKVVNERKGKFPQSRPKPYSAPADKGKQRVNDERRPSKKDVVAEIVCYTCGEKGHKSNACPGDVKRCFRCGKKGHTLAECKHDDVVCFNCNEEGHIGS